MSVTIEHADAVEWAKSYDGPLMHAMLCDPPYHLTNRTPDVKACSDCGRVLGGSDGKPDACPRCGGELIYQRSQGGRGFMSSKWDGGDVAFRPDTWAAFARVLHPGAFGMAFASSRGWHRMAVAIEDAGLIIHPSLFGWGFGSGFPKSTRIDTQIDKAAGAERIDFVVDYEFLKRNPDNGDDWEGNIDGNHSNGIDASKRFAPVTPLARAWAGHRYGLQALKPALEPIIVFQKPYAGRAVDCITRTGAGALNVDGSRIGTDMIEQGRAGRTSAMCNGVTLNSFGGQDYTQPHAVGRWPSNLLIYDEQAAAALDAQSGERPAGVAVGGKGKASSIYGTQLDRTGGDDIGYGDTGGASRFFFNVRETIDDADPLFYAAKASRRERDAGLEGMPEREKYGGNSSEVCRNCGRQRVNVSGACVCDAPDFTGAYTTKLRNHHPCCKPLALTRYLATLLLPPTEYAPRRLFCPFAGAGSECIGAMQAGWDEVVGVEMMNDEEHNYVDIARARVAYWQAKQGLFAGVDK